jgi:hypothetical protein
MSDALKRLRERVKATTVRKDGIYTISPCPPCQCPTCSDDVELLELYDEAMRVMVGVHEWLEGEGLCVPDDVPEVTDGFEQERVLRAFLAKAGGK